MSVNGYRLVNYPQFLATAEDQHPASPDSLQMAMIRRGWVLHLRNTQTHELDASYFVVGIQVMPHLEPADQLAAQYVMVRDVPSGSRRWSARFRRGKIRQLCAAELGLIPHENGSWEPHYCTKR